jgi:spore coat polysaccharide biosynthesis protein SpsF
MSRIGIILFARMSSSRLPGKMLRPLGPTSLLERVVARTRTLAYPIVLATSSAPSDDELCEEASRLGIPVFRGSLDDVLGRACAAARSAEFDAFARLCGDRPFLPLDDTRRGMALMHDRLLHAAPCDIVTNSGPRPVPSGLTMEVIRTTALERLRLQATSPEEREHVTSGFYLRGSEYSIVQLPSALHELARPGVPRLQLAVDTEDDRVQLSRVIEANPAVDLCERVAIRALLQQSLPAAYGPSSGST